MSFNWSYSKASCIDECPRKFQYEFILGRTDLVKSDSFAVGEGIHKFLEEKAKNPELTKKDCRRIYLKEALTSKSLVNNRIIMGHTRLVDCYFNHNKFISPMVINGAFLVEHFFRLRCSNEVTVNGKIDIVSLKGAVVDYKTASKKYDVKDMLNPTKGKGIQVTTYSAAVLQDFNFLPKVNGYQVILKDGKEVQNIAVEASYNAIDQVKQWYIDIHNKYLRFITNYGEKTWPKGLKPSCFWCSYKSLCVKQR